ncbi:outer membrane protein assembly factor BamD [Winogradskyella immobilis]|uniref:Outer membrane protein assembly factor BamD n=1 Tax=Winogradskyella immobilis TaxID=2816852 RepID=A0ABS8ENL6_9FLAO|nr:outer membrane protein assembly factor BamD [Winogradskyella immobilis]MCC1484799.1 outer membrane protein assembly factor BamD [Winogradskyella immobilis]MCG0016891.1 outer membrane protein assembly factor BamD [Winogradskyella immobilis]
MKKVIYILLPLILLSSCNDFQKAFKSDDIALKFEKGTELFDAGEWKKANRLFEQIVPNYRGKPQAEKLLYMHAMSFYKTEKYFISGYQFERFASSYPNSEKQEEAAFLSAKSYYYESPIYSKAQEETTKALEKLQIFINSFPNSEYLTEANQLIKELDFKLEKKAFEVAKQYNRIYDYKASIKSFNNFLLDFPGSELHKDAMYYRFLASYNLATNSIDALKEERIQEAVNYYNIFKKNYPNSEYLKTADDLKKDLETTTSVTVANNTKS